MGVSTTVDLRVLDGLHATFNTAEVVVQLGTSPRRTGGLIILMGELLPKVKSLVLRLGATTWFACIAFSLGLMGCDTGQWTQSEFKAAGIQFSIPSNWNIEVRPSGGKVVGPESGLARQFPDGAVLTALPFQEDAALVVVATQKTIDPKWFAEKASDYIPLDAVKFTQKAQPYDKESVRGFHGEGTGVTPMTKVPVYFRTLAVAINGKAVMLTLYAEESRKNAFAGVFEQILASLKAAPGSQFTAPKAEAVKPTPAKAAKPVVDATPDAGVETDADEAKTTADAGPEEVDATEDNDAAAAEEKPDEVEATGEVEEPKAAEGNKDAAKQADEAEAGEAPAPKAEETPKAAEPKAKTPDDKGAATPEPEAAKKDAVPAKTTAKKAADEPKQPATDKAPKAPAAEAGAAKEAGPDTKKADAEPAKDEAPKAPEKSPDTAPAAP